MDPFVCVRMNSVRSPDRTKTVLLYTAIHKITVWHRIADLSEIAYNDLTSESVYCKLIWLMASQLGARLLYQSNILIIFYLQRNPIFIYKYYTFINVSRTRIS